MDFSKMRHRITFLKPSEVLKNLAGENIPVYSEYKTVWAYVAPKTGREYDESQKIRAETTYNITTRYHGGITTDMRIKFGEKEFKIESILNIDERNNELKIVASEVDKNGKEES